MHNQMRNGNRLVVGSRFVFHIEKEGDHPVKTTKAFSFFNHVPAWKSHKGRKRQIIPRLP
jgi:hypothetical protein